MRYSLNYGYHIRSLGNKFAFHVRRMCTLQKKQRLSCQSKLTKRRAYFRLNEATTYWRGKSTNNIKKQVGTGIMSTVTHDT